MKVIDLLNKIANGEELPQKIAYDKKVYKVSKNFFTDVENETFFKGFSIEQLNDEVEIIEEDKEIEHYDMFDNFTGFGFGGTDKELLSDLQNNFEHINEELDYLIKAVNELKKGK